MMWYLKAAEQGDTDSCYNVGIRYYNGRGVDKDYTQAYVWFSLAAQSGDEDALTMVKRCEEKMTADELSKAKAALAEASKRANNGAKGTE